MPPDRALSAEETRELLNVSRETCDRLKAYLDRLGQWQRAINLVGSSTLKDPWRRHILDCGQLVRLLPSGDLTIADLGSGAGLPGVILAILTRHRVHLIESDQRKAVFLREITRELALTNVQIHASRIESIAIDPVDVITARALAKVGKLLSQSSRLWQPCTVGLFLKGAKLDEELTTARRSWKMNTTIHHSLADPTGRILQVREVHRAG